MFISLRLQPPHFDENNDLIKYDKKRYQKQLKRGRHYEWMKQLSTFCGLDKGWKVLMGGIDWEGQAPWCLQGTFSGGEHEACTAQRQQV